MRPGGLRGTAQGPGHPSPSSCLQVGLKLRWGGSVPTRPPGEGFRCLTREQRPRPISLHKNCRPARPCWGQWSQVRLGLIGAASASGSGSHLRATLQTPRGGGAGAFPGARGLGVTRDAARRARPSAQGQPGKALGSGERALTLALPGGGPLQPEPRGDPFLLQLRRGHRPQQHWGCPPRLLLLP